VSASGPLALAFVVSAVGEACRPSGGSRPPEAVEVEVGAPPIATTVVEAGNTCARASEFEVEARVGFDPTHVGFAPNALVVFGAGVYMPLFSLEGSDEGNDRLGCSTRPVDAGAGPDGLWVECQDGPVTRSANVRIADGQLVADIADEGLTKRVSRPLGPCAQRIRAGRLERPRENERAKGRCQDAAPPRPVDGYLRRGKMDRVTGLVPLFLEVPALGLSLSIGETTADPELCSSAVTRRGWAWVKCGAGEDASYAKVTPLPGEVVIDPASVGSQAQRRRIPVPCALRVVLHDLPFASKSADPPAASGTRSP
jgi:hypothetical protein